MVLLGFGTSDRTCDDCGDICTSDCCCQAVDFGGGVAIGPCYPEVAPPNYPVLCQAIVSVEVCWGVPPDCLLELAEGAPLDYYFYLGSCGGSPIATRFNVVDSGCATISRFDMFGSSSEDCGACVNLLCLEVKVGSETILTCTICPEVCDVPSDCIDSSSGGSGTVDGSSGSSSDQTSGDGSDSGSGSGFIDDGNGGSSSSDSSGGSSDGSSSGDSGGSSNGSGGQSGGGGDSSSGSNDPGVQSSSDGSNGGPFGS
jgi:hypothetical protein